MTVSSVPVVGHPDSMPPSVRTNATVSDEQGVLVGAHDSAVITVPAESAGNVGYLIAEVESHVQMVVKPKFLDGFVPDQELALMNPTEFSHQLDVPVQHFGDGYTVTFLNPDAAARNAFLTTLQVIGPTVDDMVLPYLSHSKAVAALAMGASSLEELIPQAGVYDRVTITATLTDTGTVELHWKQVYDSGAGFELLDVVDVLGPTAGAGVIEADVAVRTPGLSVVVVNGAAGPLDAVVLTRAYRLSS